MGRASVFEPPWTASVPMPPSDEGGGSKTRRERPFISFCSAGTPQRASAHFTRASVFHARSAFHKSPTGIYFTVPSGHRNSSFLHSSFFIKTQSLLPWALHFSSNTLILNISRINFTKNLFCSTIQMILSRILWIYTV